MEVAPELVSKLNYGTSNQLETVAKRVKASKEIGVNIVREHPYYSRLPNCKMEEKIKEVESKLTNQKYAALHNSMSKSKDCLKGCISRTDESDASLQDANHVYNELLPILNNICHVYSHPLILSDRCAQLIQKFHECWDNRHNHLKNFEMVDAEAMLAQGIKYLEAAVKAGSDEADQAVQEVITEDTKKYLKNFEDKVSQLEKFTQDSIKDYSNHDVKLKDDLKTLDNVLNAEKSAHEDATNKHQNKSNNLREKIKTNHEKQEELRRQLKILEDEERSLLDENDKENESHNTNTKNYHTKRDSLLITKSNFMKLKNASEGCNDIMNKIQAASNDLANCCIKTKKNTNQLMMDTHRTAFERYREALVMLIVTYRVQIRDSKMNIDYLQEQLDKLKIDLEKAVQGALNVVVEQKRAEVTRYQRALVQQKGIIKASQDRVEKLEDDLAKCDKELDQRHGVKPEAVTDSYKKRLDTIETRWKSDGIGSDHIQKLSLLPDPELRGDTIRSLDPVSTS